MANHLSKRIFFVAPIGAPRSEVRRRSDMMFKHVVLPAATEAGYELVRADSIAAPGNITSQVVRHVMESPIVIADLSGSNPNVMYELALRHSVGKPVIQITTDITSVPFDVAAMRTIIVQLDDLDSVETSRGEILRAIRFAEENPRDFGSPVAAAFDVASIEKEALKTPEVRSLDVPDAVLNTLKDIDQRLKALEFKIGEASKPEEKSTYSRRIFIVHGHDGEAKTELARLLEKLDFKPVILHEQRSRRSGEDPSEGSRFFPDKGATIFSKLNGELSDVGFAFVLLTPDDVGAIAPQAAHLSPRARQNVVFEHGLFVGRLAPSRVCAITKGDIEIPSDLQGVLYKRIPAGGGVWSIALDVVQELRAAGYDVDANRL